MPGDGVPTRFSPGRSLLYAAILVTAFFGALEGLLRLAGVRGPAERPRILLREMDSDIILPFVRADPDVFWSPQPGFRGEFKGRPVSINSLGLRGPEPSASPAPGRRRIACFGDSITFGFGVGDEETYCHLLGAELADRGVEVVNAGVTGFTSHQVLGWLRRLAPAIHVDVATVLVGWNDRNRRPLTDREYEGRLRAARTLEGPLGHLRLYAALQGLYRRARGEAPRATPVVERVPPDQYRENLLGIVALCRSRGIVPVFVALPHRKRPGDPPAPVSYAPLLAEIARESGTPLLDVGELGLDTSLEDNGADFIDPLHLSPRGNARMARRLAAQLLALGILSPSAGPQRGAAPS